MKILSSVQITSHLVAVCACTQLLVSTLYHQPKVPQVLFCPGELPELCQVDSSGPEYDSCQIWDPKPCTNPV